MEARDVIRFTVRSVRSHGMRSVLTAIGIGVGVSAVVLLTSLGEGLHQFVIGQFAQFGTNSLNIAPGRPNALGATPAVINTVRPLTIEDGVALSRLPQIQGWVPGMIGISEIEANGRQVQTTVAGSGPDAIDFFKFYPALGQYLPDDDPEAPRPFVVLGNQLSRDLYGDKNPLGDRVRISGSRFRVIGVMEKKGNMLGFDLDNIALIPAARALQLYNENGLMDMNLLYPEGARVEEVVESVRRLLIARHGHEDFSIRTPQQMQEILDSVLNVLKLGVAALGSISLLVGGVGIFTIMTIAVRERTPEIGLLRAVGSTRQQINQLFLSESVVLGAFGGLLGLALGIGVAGLLGLAVPSLPISISVPYVVAAELVAVFIGLVAGLLPARRAAALDPLEALRAE